MTLSFSVRGSPFSVRVLVRELRALSSVGCATGILAADFKLRGQLESSVCGPPDHLAEGFGRFSPPDFARYTVMARSSLMESQTS